MNRYNRNRYGSGPRATGPYPLHEPARPAWRCGTCDEQWPCRRRRALLRAECGGSKIHLALALAPYYAAATLERPDVTPAVFHVRFLGGFVGLR
jgi:hypothetical protein